MPGTAATCSSGASRTRFNEPLDVSLRLFDHQMTVERELRDGAARLHDHRPERDVRDEMTVHHVDVDPVRSGSFDRGDGVRQSGKVRGKDGRSELRFSHA